MAERIAQFHSIRCESARVHFTVTRQWRASKNFDVPHGSLVILPVEIDSSRRRTHLDPVALCKKRLCGLLRYCAPVALLTDVFPRAAVVGENCDFRMHARIGKCLCLDAEQFGQDSVCQ